MKKQGYKYTEEFGYIPKDWGVSKLGKYIKVQGGYSFNSENFRKSGVPVIRISNILGDDVIIGDDTVYYEPFNIREEYIIENEDILIAMSGATTGKVGVYRYENLAYQNQRVGRFVSISNDMVMTYLKQFLKFNTFINELNKSLAQGAQPNISSKQIEKISITVPNKKEQEKIAEVLGDVDGLIEKTQRLIEKKKNLKTAAMQKLLSPKDDWSSYIMGEMGSTYSGLSGKNKEAFGNGNSLYIPFLNIMNNPVIDIKALEKVYINDGESQNLCLKDDLFFNTSSETSEEVGMCATLQEDIPNLYLNSFCFGYRLKQNIKVVPKFLVYLFRGQYGRTIMQILAQGSTRYNLPKDKFMGCKITLPKYEEQRGTVVILSDMDKEIEALEKELSKYKNLKTGMMQELLTGKVRLI